MDLNAALALAQEHLTKHGLTADGWKAVSSHAKQQLGVCRYSKKEIALSWRVVAAATEDDVEQVILHEVAHALVGHAAAHGPRWKAKAAELGYRGERLSANPHYEKLKASRAIDAPLEIGAVVTDGVWDAQVIHFQRGKVYAIVLTGRRRGKIIYQTPEHFTVVKASTPSEATVAAKVWATDQANRAKRRQSPPASKPRMTPPPLRKPAAEPVQTVPRSVLVPGATVTTKRATGVIASVGTRYVYFKTAEGANWRADVGAIVTVTPPTASTLPKAPVRLKKETHVEITDPGKYCGVRGVITKVNPTRYVLRIDGSFDTLTVPHDLVKAV